MNQIKSSPLNSSVFALAISAVALLVTMVLRSYLEPEVALLFLLATWVGAWYFGRAGGVTAAIASSASLVYFFLRPDITGATWWNVTGRLLGFLLPAVLLIWTTSSWRENRRLFSATISSIGDAVLATDRDGRVTFLNPVAATLTGWPVAEAHGKPAAEILKLVDEKSHEPVEDPLERTLRESATVMRENPTALLSRSGVYVPVEHSASPVRDENGDVRGAILVFRDIGKRRQLEEQSTHAEKMEAVGRLAGGVAGDFNNVLTVITGYAELLRAEVPSASPLRRFVDEIIYAAERAAALTRHLLAFSRGPTTQPRAIDLNVLIGGMEPMLRRLLGQSNELMLLTSPGLGRVRADPAQIEQVIVNLVTNARDAMPNGGKVVVETANIDLEEANSKKVGVPPGPYVMMAFSDTGVGMDPETRSHLFEPFFTTKTPGKGSGLGLATVYGTIKQSEGQVTVYSQPGCGTIFEIYLPRVLDSVGEPARKNFAKGSETILLVDDEEGVRKLVSAVLKSNGYDVLEAANGPAALSIYEKNGHKVDLVLTDVVMPVMNGFELGRQLSERTPGLRILYMSGYRDNPSSSAPLDSDPARVALLKPFTPDVLLTKVREVLDAAQ